LGVSVVLLAFAAALPSGGLLDILKLILLVLALLFDILAFASRFYTYLMVPALQQRSKDIILSNDEAYTISPSADSTIHKEGSEFVATVYVSIPLYRSATEMSDEEKLDFTRQVSKLVGVSGDPVRFTSELYVMNKDAYIQTLKDTINSLENDVVALTSKKSQPKELDRAKGKLAMWHNMLDNIEKVQSLELVTYAAVSAKGTKEFEAVSIAQQRARDIMSGIGSIFGVTPSIVTGQELLKFIEPEYLIPFSTISEQLSRNIQQVI
jgi:hypothetical protein